MPIDVEILQCDALCTTGRKYLRGPRGTGFLYVRKSKIAQLEPPFLDLLAAQWAALNQYQTSPIATRFETWERNYSNMIGLSSAIEYALSWGLENIWNRICTLANAFRKKLSAIPGITLKDLGEKKCGIVTLIAKGTEPTIIARNLNQKGINVWVSIAEYARLDFEKRVLKSLVRASIHYYNTDEEIDRFCEELKYIIQVK